ncbi:hypothetical protein K388_07178 [Streptomyces sp. KhCrAH-43]|uniref:hypothetical protein n=1 Tax=unclassified Streptomyces TaxID=2593676 RepID=UPI00037F7873|nr:MULTISPECIES: hypothetical protein [unclassified Streptomyces]MYS39110.1 hypothetical protein [Streptomyces sp. SID4920]MYX63943.1 hypothetical protein [Streptomyces sp. SID8373]RAJ47797.1 hypothetical protein K388_07178 [Streptomyces sp. KhCrAH-43]
MAIDHEKQRRTQEAAEELLRERYGRSGSLLDPLKVMREVRARALGYSSPDGQDAVAVPAEDVLAALTQIAEARASLDRLEHDLIRAARIRSASWQKIADSLALANRQAAEARATRLERAVESHRGDRDVRTQRRDRAQRRRVESWCREHETRVRAVADRLVDVAGAWPKLAEDAAASAYMDLLSKAANDVQRVDCLEVLHGQIAPNGRNREGLEPSGPQADEAALARDAVRDLLEELSAVRLAADDARLSTNR